MSSPAPATVTDRPDRALWAHYAQGIWFQLIIFAIGCLIVFSRRPDALLNAQFYAEDGSLFYRDAYQSGLHSLLMTYSGYFHILLRLTALLARLFPFAWAPLVMTTVAITFQVLPVNLFFSSRFSQISFPIRMLAGFIYLALPNSFEIDANLTNMHWHLGLLACLLVLAKPPTTRAWKMFDAVVLVLTSISSPLGALLLPVAAGVWWKRADTSSVVSFAFLLPGAAMQTISVLLHWGARQVPHYGFTGQAVFNVGPNGANIHYFAAIMGRQVFLSALLGLNTQKWILLLHHVSAVEVLSTLVGLALLLYALRYAPTELKLFILFAGAALTLALLNPLAGSPDHSQWYWLSTPACGNRYYFLLMIAFLATLIWVASRRAAPRVLRSFALTLLLLLPVGIYRDWRYPPFLDFRFEKFATAFERAPSGSEFIIPINPGWLMELTKR
ncbi:MAG: hypothetical protein DMG92_07750 [Acidobacteria bacterium]|nr:MAG: hypothetical protein DMG92_07750 [Acidobacteriota bacterium]